MRSHKFTDHTADLGIELQADSLKELLAAGAEALTEAAFGPVELGTGSGTVEKWTTGETDPEWILFGFMKHWLTVFHLEERVLVPSLPALESVTNQAPDLFPFELISVPGTTAALLEIKAITLHAFRVWNEEKKWHATVIVDI